MRGRVGLLGGTFNPLHNGHILIARNALTQFRLSRVTFVPNGTPPSRREEALPSREDRFRMVAEALVGEERLVVSRVEVDREGPSYTIDTIRALKDDCPEGICFIIGADSLLQIDTWREPEAVIASVPFVVAPRQGVALSVFECEPFDGASIHVLDMPEVDVSSTALRERVRRGLTIAPWVPARVAAYIEEHGLYRDAGTA